MKKKVESSDSDLSDGEIAKIMNKKTIKKEETKESDNSK